MTPFCANPKCDLNKQELTESRHIRLYKHEEINFGNYKINKNVPVWEQETEIKAYTAHEFRRGNERFFFCSECYDTMAMLYNVQTNGIGVKKKTPKITHNYRQIEF